MIRHRPSARSGPRIMCSEFLLIGEVMPELIKVSVWSRLKLV